MLPVTGPHKTDVSSLWLVLGSVRYDKARRVKTGYRQRHPYNLNLPFDLEHHRAHGNTWITSELGSYNPPYHYDAVNSTGVDHGGLNGFKTRPFNPFDARVVPYRTAAINSARAEFSEKLGEAAEIAMMYMERKQTMETLTKRLRQMARFAHKLRTFKFVEAGLELLAQKDHLSKTESKKLRLQRKRIAKIIRDKVRGKKLRRSAKAFGDNFLEYRFMWSATVKDINSAVDVLQDAIPPVSVRAFGSSRPITVVGKYSDSYPDSKSNWTSTQQLKFNCNIGAEIRIANPNLWLANRLGLINPAYLLYEKTTLSFVVNWFVNIEEFLRQYTETCGLSVIDPWMSWKYTCSSRWVTSDLTFSAGRWKSTRASGGGSTEWKHRENGLPGVSLAIRKPWTMSKIRAVTAISLLLQRLKR